MDGVTNTIGKTRVLIDITGIEDSAIIMQDENGKWKSFTIEQPAKEITVIKEEKQNVS